MLCRVVVPAVAVLSAATATPSLACQFHCAPELTVAPHSGAIGFPTNAAVGIALVHPAGPNGTFDPADVVLDPESIAVQRVTDGIDVAFDLEQVGVQLFLIRPKADLDRETSYVVTGNWIQTGKADQEVVLTAFTTASSYNFEPHSSTMLAWREVEDDRTTCPQLNAVRVSFWPDSGTGLSGLFEVQVAANDAIESGQTFITAGPELAVGFGMCVPRISGFEGNADLHVRYRPLAPTRDSGPGPWSGVQVAPAPTENGCATLAPASSGASVLLLTLVVVATRRRRGQRWRRQTRREGQQQED